MAQFTYDSYVNAKKSVGEKRQTNAQRADVSFFKLVDDGDTAVVRFAYQKPEEFELVTVHSIKIKSSTTGKEFFRRVSCLRDSLKEDINKCPLCALAESNPNYSRVARKFYVKLIEYVKDENGVVKPEARIWERPASFAIKLGEYFTEYGDISDLVFKVKRHGQRGSIETEYEVIPANPNIYKEEIYKKDFSVLDGVNAKGFAYAVKSAEDIKYALEHGEFPAPVKEETPKQEPKVEVIAEATLSVKPEPKPVLDLPDDDELPFVTTAKQPEQPKPETTENKPRRYTF